MLLAETSLEISPKHKEYFFILESSALNWYIFVALTNEKLLLQLQCRLTNVVVSSYPCIGPKPRIKISFFLLSICTDELVSTQKIMTFVHTLPSGNENSKGKSNLIP